VRSSYRIAWNTAWSACCPPPARSRAAPPAHHDAATIGACEQPRLAPECDATQRPFGRVVRQADPTIVEKAAERLPTLEHVVHGFGDVGMPRHFASRGPHPGHTTPMPSSPHLPTTASQIPPTTLLPKFRSIIGIATGMRVVMIARFHYSRSIRSIPV
jgi:hypothetical protein